MATVGCCVNFYQIRQRVVKHAIFVTRSNNPRVVKAASVFVGGSYLLALFAVWHLPPLFLEISLRNMMGVAMGVFSWLNPHHKLLPALFNASLEKITQE